MILNYIGDFPNISFQGGSIDLRIQNNSILSISNFKGAKDTVKIVLQKTMFSRFAYYSMWEKDSPTGGPIWWANNDTVNGPFHTQDDLRASKHPVFKGETSHKGDLIYYEKQCIANLLSAISGAFTGELRLNTRLQYKRC